MDRSDNQASPPTQSPYLTPSFKMWVVGFIFFLTFFHLFTLLAFDSAKILSHEFLLGLVLALVGYLWAQETRDRDRILDLHDELAAAHEKLQKAEVDTIRSLINLVEAKDPHVHGHSERVARICLALGKDMEFSQDTLDSLWRAAVLHDLGKLAIRDEILKKSGKLTDEEWEIVKKHPEFACAILAPLKFLHLEKNIIRHHHERMDGKGYPDKLSGAQIPQESRIIAVAETFDEMNSATSYRDALPKETVVSELKKAGGTQLDPALVDRFFKILQENPEFWGQNA